MSTDKVEAAVFASIIKQAREERGWTRYKLASLAHIQETHLAKIEEGEYCVRIDIVNRLAIALGIEVVFPL